MGHVVPGKAAKAMRRKSAYERLGNHLSEHRKFHKKIDEEIFKNHDRLQRAEHDHIGDIISGKITKTLSKSLKPENLSV